MSRIISKALGISLGLACLWIACSPDQLSPADYLRYVKDQDNGFIKRQDHLAGMFLEAFYQPPEFVSLLAWRRKEIQQEALHAEIEKNSNFYHFFFTIGSNDERPIDEILRKTDIGTKSFDAKRQQMLYQTQPSFSIFLEGDSIPCTFCHAQLSGKIDNAYHFIIAFEPDAATHMRHRNKNLTLVYNDSIWFQKRFEFNFDINKISQSPKLKI